MQKKVEQEKKMWALGHECTHSTLSGEETVLHVLLKSWTMVLENITAEVHRQIVRTCGEIDREISSACANFGVVDGSGGLAHSGAGVAADAGVRRGVVDTIVEARLEQILRARFSSYHKIHVEMVNGWVSKMCQHIEGQVVENLKDKVYPNHDWLGRVVHASRGVASADYTGPAVQDCIKAFRVCRNKLYQDRAAAMLARRNSGVAQPGVRNAPSALALAEAREVERQRRAAFAASEKERQNVAAQAHAQENSLLFREAGLKKLQEKVRRIQQMKEVLRTKSDLVFSNPTPLPAPAPLVSVLADDDVHQVRPPRTRLFVCLFVLSFLLMRPPSVCVCVCCVCVCVCVCVRVSCCHR
jgi:hypothetical protein